MYTKWEDFDPNEYVGRSYGSRILPEDEQLVLEVLRELRALRIPLRSLKSVVDIGAGPNLYPALLLAPFVAQDALFELQEYSEPNRTYLNRVLAGEQTSPWGSFEAFMAQEDWRWRNALETVQRQAVVRYGDVFELDQNTYDAACAFFVSESITDRYDDCRKAIECHIACLKPGGIFIAAHMLGSIGWPAGEDTLFPATPLTVDDLTRFYRGKIAGKVMQPITMPEARQGYHGMAIVIGTKH